MQVTQFKNILNFQISGFLHDGLYITYTRNPVWNKLNGYLN